MDNNKNFNNTAYVNDVLKGTKRFKWRNKKVKRHGKLHEIP